MVKMNQMKQEAEQGDPYLQLLLANNYKHGHGVKRVIRKLFIGIKERRIRACLVLSFF